VTFSPLFPYRWDRLPRCGAARLTPGLKYGIGPLNVSFPALAWDIEQARHKRVLAHQKRKALPI
jgi:hypothetical protein